MEARNSILNRPISETKVSDDFKKMCELNGYETLSDILKYKASDLTHKPNFTMKVFKELIEILKANNLESYLKN